MRLTNKPQKLPIHTQILIHNMNNFSDATGWQFFFKAKLLLLKLIFRQRWVWIYRICLSLLVQVTLKKKEFVNVEPLFSQWDMHYFVFSFGSARQSRRLISSWVREKKRRLISGRLKRWTICSQAGHCVRWTPCDSNSTLCVCVQASWPGSCVTAQLTHTHRPDKAKSQS